MITIGIISEYNPFHYGHLYQIKKAREIFGEDCAVIAIMSGNFVQRGEAALLDKWSRARAALLCGVNLVIELPVVYATGSAERFADGGVALAAATGLCDYLVFGSESGELKSLNSLAEILAFEPQPYKESLKNYLSQGLSFPVSRQKALIDFAPHLMADELLGTSNNILAIEYLKSMKRRNIISMKPFTIKREGQQYNETNPVDKDAEKSHFWSASAIRAVVANSTSSSKITLSESPSSELAKQSDNFKFSSTASVINTLINAMPKESLAILIKKLMDKECITTKESFSDNIYAFLRAVPSQSLEEIPGMNEGLANRLKEYVRNNTDNENPLAALIQNGTSKRHPSTRIQRALFNMILGIQNKDLALFDSKGGPLYLRILGFDKKGRYLLKMMKAQATLPILMKGSDFLEYSKIEENNALNRMAKLDCIATDLWMFHINKKSGCDFTTPPVSFLRAPKR